MTDEDIYARVAPYAQVGVNALTMGTPIDTGETAFSWYYEIKRKGKASLEISWHNRNEVSGIPVAILLQYGHGTGTGGYVAGVDYINPAIRPIFKIIADAVWKEVIR